MTQPVLCHCNFLEPGSVGASTLGLPSLIVLSGAVDEQMFVGHFAKLLLPRSFFLLQTLHGVTRAFCCGHKKMLHKESDRYLMPRDPTVIGAVDYPTDDEFFCISVRCFTCERWDGEGCEMDRDRKAIEDGHA